MRQGPQRWPRHLRVWDRRTRRQLRHATMPNSHVASTPLYSGSTTFSCDSRPRPRRATATAQLCGTTQRRLIFRCRGCFVAWLVRAVPGRSMTARSSPPDGVTVADSERPESGAAVTDSGVSSQPRSGSAPAGARHPQASGSSHSRRRSSYLSVRNLVRDIKEREHRALGQLLREHQLVGGIDDKFSLIQARAPPLSATSGSQKAPPPPAAQHKAPPRQPCDARSRVVLSSACARTNRPMAHQREAQTAALSPKLAIRRFGCAPLLAFQSGAPVQRFMRGALDLPEVTAHVSASAIVKLMLCRTGRMRGEQRCKRP